MSKFTITTKLTAEDLKKVNFYFLYKGFRMKFITGLGIFILISTAAMYFFDLIEYKEFPVFPIVLAIAMAIVPYFSVIVTSKKNYKSNKLYQEPIIYEFEDKTLSIIGESFNSEISMDSLFKFEETKNYFLIYQSPQIANIIPKRDVEKEQIEYIRSIIKH